MTRQVKAILQRMYGPTGSVVIHILVVVLLVVYAGRSVQQENNVIETSVVEQDVQTLDKVDEIVEQVPEQTPELTDVQTPPEAGDAGGVVNPSIAGVGSGEAGTGAAAGPAGDGTELNALNIISDVQGSLTLKGIYAGRGAGGRSSALGKGGGNSQTEGAVLKALQWLKRNQHADGSWGNGGGDFHIAMAGLGLLTFLAHGETLGSEEYGATVEKAIKYLVSAQKENGIFGSLSPGAGGEGEGAGSYAHAIATYGISEAYGITRIPQLKPVMDKAVDVIMKGQQDGGGWDYQYRKGARKDTSVAGWQIQALKAAMIAGSEVPGIKDALNKAVVYLKAMQNSETGQIGYSTPGQGNPPITAVGVLCMQLVGHGEDKEVEKGLQFMQGWDLRWDKPAYKHALYGWYYVTQAKFQKGGTGWQSWNQDLKKELPAAQKEDGHWEFPIEEHGSQVGPAYSTTLAALTLQVYYRFLPTYKKIEIEKPVEEKKEDVSVQVL